MHSSYCAERYKIQAIVRVAANPNAPLQRAHMTCLFMSAYQRWLGEAQAYMQDEVRHLELFVLLHELQQLNVAVLQAGKPAHALRSRAAVTGVT